MQTTLFQQADETDDLQITRTLKIVSVVEDYATHQRVRKVLDALASRLGDTYEFDHQTWKFSTLENRNLREIAAKEAAAADIIVFAMHGTEPFPAEVKSWLEMWLKPNGNPMALIALFDEEQGCVDEPGYPLHCLREAARSGKIDFFAQTEDWSGTTEEVPIRKPMLN